jgi:hypothetical protein
VDTSIPVLGTHHLEEGEITQTHVVIVDLDVEPADLASMHEALTLGLVVDLGDVESLGGGGVDAVVELASKQVDTHDTEDEPEDKADQKHIHDGGDGSQEGIHHHLGVRVEVIAGAPPMPLKKGCPVVSNQGTRQSWAISLSEGHPVEGQCEGLGAEAICWSVCVAG